VAQDASTVLVRRDGAGATSLGFRLTVLSGPDRGRSVDVTQGRLSVGSAENADLVLTDPTVSRYHLELEVRDDGIALRDLGSTNGTRLGNLRVESVVVCDPMVVSLGQTTLQLDVMSTPAAADPGGPTRFQDLIGASAAMRAVYRVLERVAPTTTPILITGESGTGKELAARAIHRASGRRDAPFEVVDCGGLPATLVESELFGHTRGAFTSAYTDHEGAFARANRGTLFLDELGELPLEVQPKLLRVLGEGKFRPVGGSAVRTSDVRIVAATHRDLRQRVNDGSFRADLYYRLAVIQVRMPSLRDRLDDLPLLVSELVARIRRERGIGAELTIDDDVLAPLRHQSWAGNVRELRNYLEHLLVLDYPPAAGDDRKAPPKLALEAASAAFEREYLADMLEQTGGNAAEAARRAGVSRATFFRKLRQHGIARD
jgi:DNA-binding NtrC family response regulator